MLSISKDQNYATAKGREAQQIWDLRSGKSIIVLSPPNEGYPATRISDAGGRLLVSSRKIVDGEWLAT